MEVVTLQVMKVTELIGGGGTAFSFEILPPRKGESIEALEEVIEALRRFEPRYINITTHRSEPVLRETVHGARIDMVRRRPGAVAVAAALQMKYGIPIVPHILCLGFSGMETEYVLLDLQFLGIENLLLLRGDRLKAGSMVKDADTDCYMHTTELIEQVNRFNDGYFLDGSRFDGLKHRFSFGVGCYPEKHDEAPNIESDLRWFRKKVEMGADYGVTQMFFDNKKYFDFVDRCRSMGIGCPIIPGIKPLVSKRQLTSLPRAFHCDIPLELSDGMMQARSAEEEFEVGVEWCVRQCKELMAAGVPSLHFYTSGRAKSVEAVAERIY